MVSLSVVRTRNTSLVNRQPLVAVFTGATSGIGLATLKALVNAHSDRGKGLRIYLVGRRAEAGQQIIKECLSRCPQGDFRFIQAKDLSLLHHVDQACDEIIRQERKAHGTTTATATGPGPAKIDLLVMSQGELTLGPRQETTEGIDFRSSLLYYSRIKTILNLLPLLTSSSSSPPTSPAHIISVFAGGMEGPTFDPADLSIRQPGRFSTTSTRHTVTAMTTLFFEHLALQHAGRLALVHVYPGLVLTEGFTSLPPYMRAAMWVCKPVLKLLTMGVPEVGERVLFLADGERFPAGGRGGVEAEAEAEAEAETQERRGGEVAMGTDCRVGSGAYGVTIYGETAGEAHYRKWYDEYRAEGVGEKVVRHTLDAFKEIEAGRVWTG